MDYIQTLEQLKDYYANLLIVQYNGLPKATATIKMIADLILANMIIFQIRDGFDWRTAVGPQLEIIGKWVGVSNTYNVSLYDNKVLLSYPFSDSLTPSVTTNASQHGYSDYTTFDSDTGGILTYKDLGFVEQKLDDEDYRVVIGLKIIKNSINHTAKNIDDAIWEYFGGQVYTTWTPHQVTYNYPSPLATIIQVCAYKNVLPAPSGVEIILREI